MADEQKKEEVVDPAQAEILAKKQGWRPKEEFGGNPEDWVDAETFLERGRTWAPITAAKNRELETVIRDMKTLLKQQMDLNHRRNVTVRQQHEQNIKTLQGRISTLEQQLAASIKSGDAEGVVNATAGLRQADAAIQENKAGLTNLEQENQRIADAWKAANPWYGEDPEATDYADMIGFRVAQQGADPQAILEAIDKKVRNKYPDLFDEAEDADPTPRPVTTRSTKRSVSKTKSDDDGGKSGGVKWNSLSSEEQDTATKVMKRFGLSKEEYLKQYSTVA